MHKKPQGLLGDAEFYDPVAQWRWLELYGNSSQYCPVLHIRVDFPVRKDQWELRPRFECEVAPKGAPLKDSSSLPNGCGTLARVGEEGFFVRSTLDPRAHFFRVGVFSGVHDFLPVLQKTYALPHMKSITK